MNTVNLNLLQNASMPGAGAVFHNDRYDLLLVQVEGTFSGLNLILEGRVESDGGPWEPISGWSAGEADRLTEQISAKGIYEFTIAGIVEIRLRIVSISGGHVTATGVTVSTADNSSYPSIDSPFGVVFGDSALFIKGVAEQIFFDPVTGNIVGYDKTPTAAAVTVTVNLQEITGGMGNKLVGVLPDTVRISGTYTSSAFSLETRERIMGGQIAYNAVSKVCETITADTTVLTVSKTPAPALGEDPDERLCWCYVRREGDETTRGQNAEVDAATGTVQNYATEVGKRYEVTYFSHIVSAQMLPVPSIWNPVVMTVQERYGVYARQNGSAEKGILKGWLYFIVPRAILNANAGLTASQTEASDTEGNWIALPEKPENMPFCDCAEIFHPAAYYVYVPCSGENEAVKSIVSVGNGLTLKAGRTAQLPLKLVMPDDSIIQPDFETINYVSDDESVATVDPRGIVTGISAGETVVHAFFSKANGAMLDCGTPISVTGTRSASVISPDNITVE